MVEDPVAWILQHKADVETFADRSAAGSAPTFTAAGHMLQHGRMRVLETIEHGRLHHRDIGSFV